MPTELVHSLSRYKKYGCRCEQCCDAYSKYRESRRKRPQKVFVPATPLIEFLESQYPARAIEMRNIMKGWRSRGTVDLYEADKVCIKLGIHPYEIFGEIYFLGLEPEEISA